jgi:hypothetical protein
VLRLYLEFWGPEATPAAVAKAKGAIESTWGGKQTSDGKTLHVEVITRIAPGAAAAPGTPGYHQIQLIGSGISVVSGTFGVNEGTGQGTWRTQGDNLEKMYAHEAGHLLGFGDRYDDYRKLPDGSWELHGSDQTLTAAELAEKMLPSQPGQTVQSLTQWLNDPARDRVSISHAGHENDLMASLQGQVLQEDIDALAAMAGVIVEVRPGDILVNKSDEEQNYVITRSQDVFVPPGGQRTLEGVYVACIDLVRSVPHPGRVMDVGPPLSTWRGIEAASHLAQLVRYIDENEYFCGTTGQWQLAIWRVTDNLNISLADDLLLSAGVALDGGTLDFPRLSSPEESGVTTSVTVPRELVIPDVAPLRVLTTVGAEVEFTGRLQFPDFGDLSATYEWFLEAPSGSDATIGGSAASVLLTTDARGHYQIGMDLTLHGPAEDVSFQRFAARVVAADQKTDTFERPTLDVAGVPWQTGGVAPWTISELDAFTGLRAARSGEIEGDSVSVLAVTFTLMEAGEVSFAYRVSSEEHYDFLTFEINDEVRFETSGEVEWKTVRYELGEGEHTLRWTYSKDEYGDVGLDAAWIDDVFFPPGVVGIAAEHSDKVIPDNFRLLPNYPNPFNPSTTISYDLPSTEHVSLRIYDALGRVVSVLVNEEKPAARHTAVFEAGFLPSGVYFYRIEAGIYKATGKMLLVK